MSRDRYRIGRKLHLLVGLIGALWLVFMSVSGMLINHQESLGLGEKEIRNRYLPHDYRIDPQVASTRLNVIIADLHSGRFFGKHGYLISDVIGGVLILSVLSGLYIYWFGRRVKAGPAQNGAFAACTSRAATEDNGRRLENGSPSDYDASVLIDRPLTGPRVGRSDASK